MGKDYKIGIVIGLAVLIFGVGALLMRSPDEKAPDTPPEEKTGSVVIAEGTTEVEPAEPVSPWGEPAAPPTSSEESAMDEEVGEIIIPTPGSPASPSVEPVPAESSESEVATPSPSESLPVEPPASPSSPVETFDPTAATPTPVEPASPVALTGKTYTVQDGDNGFWFISEKVYGNGKYWKLIADANPSVNSKTLRKGMTLKIPPLPTAAVRPSRVVDKTQWGKISTDPLTGKKFYIVKEGDRGFWDIAKAAYGKGHLWEGIKKANPTLDPLNLRPGTRVIIPLAPLASTSTTALTPTNANAGKIVTINGQRFYIVKSRDNGFWSASKAAYGKGDFFETVRKANPDLDSRDIKPGTKIRIPDLPARITRPAPGTAVTARSAKHGEVITENGRKYYVVADGDQGFWGISIKVFKTGVYSEDIAKANPGVNSNRLKPGDKIRIPDITPATVRPRTERRLTPITPAPGGDDEPIFE